MMSKADIEIKKIEELTKNLNQRMAVSVTTSNPEENIVDPPGYIRSPVSQTTIGKNWGSPHHAMIPEQYNDRVNTDNNNTRVNENLTNTIMTGRTYTNAERVTKPTAAGEMAPANIDLVVCGIEKDVSEYQLVDFLYQRGLPTKHCKLLTTFKVTINPSDYENSRNP